MKKDKQKVIVIGSGFSGLAAACFLAKEGKEVIVLEKNESIGGRARVLKQDGFTFDMGPSWYWMPDVFERFFSELGKNIHDYVELIRLDPSYKIFWNKNESWDIPANLDELKALLEKYEKGAAHQLDLFLADAKYKYDVSMQKLVYNASSNPLKHLSKEVAEGVFKLNLFSSFRTHAQKYFKHPFILGLMEFPVLFLGATAKEIPALFSLMNYADIALGTWYPQGGMGSIVEAIKKVAEELGVQFKVDSEVKKLEINSKKEITAVNTDKESFICDAIVNTADYHYFDSELLPEKYRNYSEKYWDKKVLAPSSLLFYLGISKKLNNMLHHNLFFDESMDVHADEIYTHPKWPTKPLFYTSIPSITDSTVAPQGMECLTILIPLAPDLKDSKEMQEHYYNYVMDKLADYCGEDIRPYVILKHNYCLDNFKKDYHAYKGNAYGLSNTLLQTAFMRPRMKSKKIRNLFHAGQLTLPGPGVPPSLISGEIVVKELLKN